MEIMTIESGAENWQIFQQKNGFAKISLKGKYDSNTDGDKCISVVDEMTNEYVIDKAHVNAHDGRWNAEINIPAGGTYRIESYIMKYGEKGLPAEHKGEFIHHIGVGDIYVICGQSNAAGTGKGLATNSPEIGVHTLRDRSYWDMATSVLNSDRDRYSPFLAFGKKMKEKLGYPIGIVSFAYGGSPISQWLPEQDGVWYNEMVEVCKERNISPKAILWYQGCSDAIAGLADKYMDNFKTFVNNCRRDFKDENLPIITCQINTHRDYAPGEERDYNWAVVREAQRIAPRVIKNCYVTTTFDLSMSDGIHNNTSASNTLGERMAYLALNKLYGLQTPPVDAPDIESAKMADDFTLKLKFKNIQDMIYIFHAGIDAPIEIEDENGRIDFTDIYEHKDTLTLTLSRKPVGEAFVSAMAKATVTRYIVDFSSQLPALGFYKLKVEN